MATIQTLADRTMRILGVRGSGESATSDEVTDFITALNGMLESWQNERLMAYTIDEVTHTLTANDGEYTIGSGGDINTTRPVKIEQAFVRSGNDDYPVDVLSVEEWNRISDKTVTSDIVEKLYYKPSMSTGTIYLYPVPTEANALHLFVRIPITSYSASTDTVTLPPGWDQAIVFNVALVMADEFGVEPSQNVFSQAMKSLAAIKRLNRPSMKTHTELGEIFSGARTNILSGG